jgi:hypothetical protein
VMADSSAATLRGGAHAPNREPLLYQLRMLLSSVYICVIRGCS